MIQESIDLLGFRAKDKISGLEGIISAISFDLYGCVVAVITPPVKADGSTADCRYVDIQRLEILSIDRVMPVPNFSAVARKPSEYRHGAAEKPLRALGF